MWDLDARLRILRQLPEGPRLTGLAAAVCAASGDEQNVVLAELLGACGSRRVRVSQRARICLLGTWGSLSLAQRQSALVTLGEELPGLLAIAVREETTGGAGLRAWGDLLGDAALAEAMEAMVARQVTHPAALLDLIDAAARHCGAVCDEVAGSARAAVATMAAAYPSRLSVGLDPHADALRQAVDAQLAQLAQTYDEHRDDGVLAGAILQSGSPGPAVRAWLASRDDVGHMALRRVAKTLRPAAQADMTTAWLGRPALAGLAERALTGGGGAAWTVALMDWPLLIVPARAKRVSKLRRLGEGMLNAAQWREMPEGARRGAVMWTQVAHMREHDRRVRLSWHLGDASVMVRHAAVRALAQRPASAELDAAIIDFAHDADERVADAALSALGRARGTGRRRALTDAIATAQRSAHPRVRGRARQLRGVFDAFHWPTTSAARWHAPAAARALLAREPEAFMDELRARLGEAGTETRRSALWLVQRLELANECIEALIAIALGVADRVAVQERAKAMLLMGAVEDGHLDRASSALAHGLSDADGRIRADAVEAVGRLRGVDAAVDGFMEDDVPRVRGNAIRHAMIVEGKSGAVAQLRSMLRDHRMAHRRSALWVVERARPVELSGMIAELAQSEPESILRARTIRCARRLLCTLDREAA